MKLVEFFICYTSQSLLGIFRTQLCQYLPMACAKNPQQWGIVVCGGIEFLWWQSLFRKIHGCESTFVVKHQPRKRRSPYRKDSGLGGWWVRFFPPQLSRDLRRSCRQFSKRQELTYPPKDSIEHVEANFPNKFECVCHNHPLKTNQVEIMMDPKLRSIPDNLRALANTLLLCTCP